MFRQNLIRTRLVSNLPYNGGCMLRVVVIGLALLATASAQTNPDLAALQQVIEMHKAGDYAGAIVGYQRFLKAHPEVSSVRSNLGAALAHEGRFDDAIREYR